MRFCLTILLIFFCFTTIGQTRKSLNAKRIETPPEIDGIPNDEVWKGLERYGGFFMFEPGNEAAIDPEYRSEVQMAYDDNNVYVAAYLYDPYPENIISQFSQRDEVFVQADHFAIALNTYDDGINEFFFYVTSAGTIGDARAERSRSDFSFNVVFECQTSRDQNGWYAEFRIPYNALRFPEVQVQDWSVNFYRRINRINQTHSWNFIDITTGAASLYSGEVLGVQGIEPPLRLTMFPFAQGLVSIIDNDLESDFSAGMDIKYGLTDSFTLDATLIPDFGQVAFDEVRLNLGPFEQTFNENRQFFVEGTELFNKGGLFFSRRIGNAPSPPSEDLDPNEQFDELPERVNLLNAVKISGRTKGKLGLGVLNAITENTPAKVIDTITGSTREVVVEPLANYNIIVVDQQFNNNSSVSLTNTNVMRNGSFRDANATALSFDLADRGNNYRLAGRGLMSNVWDNGQTTGFRTELDFFKTKGRFRYRIGHDFADTNFDINDMGLIFRNNFNNFVAGASYQIFEPTENFNRYRFEFTVRHRRLFKPGVQTENNFNLDWFFFTTERFAFGGFLGFNSEEDDYFEPRIEGRFVTFSSNLGGRIWCSSDYRKKFAIDAGIGHRTWFDDPQVAWFIDFSPRYRFSDKFLLILSTDISNRDKEFGYIDDNQVDVFMGQRDVTNVENVITASYNFDPFKAIDLRFRNFWSTADYSDNLFFVLNEDGSRSTITYDTMANDPNRNFNIWNLDLSFRWRFAPGSEATLLFRNQLFNEDVESTLNYGESLKNLFAQPEQNTVSLRITYFIDYNNIRGFIGRQSS